MHSSLSTFRNTLYPPIGITFMKVIPSLAIRTYNLSNFFALCANPVNPFLPFHLLISHLYYHYNILFDSPCLIFFLWPCSPIPHTLFCLVCFVVCYSFCICSSLSSHTLPSIFSHTFPNTFCVPRCIGIVSLLLFRFRFTNPVRLRCMYSSVGHGEPEYVHSDFLRSKPNIFLLFFNPIVSLISLYLMNPKILPILFLFLAM